MVRRVLQHNAERFVELACGSACRDNQAVRINGGFDPERLDMSDNGENLGIARGVLVSEVSYAEIMAEIPAVRISGLIDGIGPACFCSATS